MSSILSEELRELLEEIHEVLERWLIIFPDSLTRSQVQYIIKRIEENREAFKVRAIYFMGRQTGRTLFILREVENMIEQDGIKRVYEEMKAFKESDEPVYPMGKEEVYDYRASAVLSNEAVISAMQALEAFASNLGKEMIEALEEITPEEPAKPKPPYARTGVMKKSFRHKEPPQEYKIFHDMKPIYRPIIFTGKRRR